MSAKWEKQEGNQGILTIEVSADEFDKALDQAFNKVVKDVEIPGFRKGKVPRKIFESRFGVESLYQDAVDIVLPDAYSNAVEETGIEPIEQPDVDIEQIEKGKDLIFKATVNVKPEVTLGQYKGLEVEEQSVEVTDDDVEQELENLREQHAELIVKENGEVENGDTVVIDFKGYVDGEPFEGGEAKDFNLEIGSGQLVPGFEDGLIGKQQGTDVEVHVTFPEDYHAEHLVGKDAVFEVTIHEVKTKELPDLDDEFAKDVDDDVETLDELREKKKEEMQSEREQQAENQKRESLIEQASENAEVTIPDAMVESELDRMLQEFEQQLQGQGMTMDMYYQFSGQTQDDLKDQMRDDAQKRVKTDLTLEAIYYQENLEVTDEDVDKELEKMASMYGTNADQLKQMLGGNLDALKNELKSTKSIEFLVEHSQVV